MNYLDIANSNLLYLMSALIILCVSIICVRFIHLSMQRAKELGIDKKIVHSTLRSSAIFSIAPSLPIIIALLAMMGVLGKPFSWLRLSIIGSFQYELLTANIGASAMGVESLSSPNYTAQVFSNSMWVMSIGIIWGMILCLFYLKTLHKKLDLAKKKDETAIAVLISSLYFGMISVFVGPPIVRGGLELYTLAFSALMFLLLTQLQKKLNFDALQDFTFTLSMISGMILAVILS